MKTSTLAWLPLNKGVNVLSSHECGIFALEKPAGTMTHPNAPGLSNAKNSMLVADYSLKNECYFCRGNDGAVRKIFVLNRLDSPTSGIVLCSENSLVAQIVRDAFLKDDVRKTYYAIVCGNAPEKQIWKDWLIREKTLDGSLRVKIAANSKLRGAQFAETELIKNSNQTGNFHLVKLLPHTGRTHQLRVQCASHGVPILGDKSYGETEINKLLAETQLPGAKNRLFLHAGETSLTFPWRAGTVNFSAHSELPKIFSEILGKISDSPSGHIGEKPLSRFRVRVK